MTGKLLSILSFEQTTKQLEIQCRSALVSWRRQASEPQAHGNCQQLQGARLSKCIALVRFNSGEERASWRVARPHHGS